MDYWLIIEKILCSKRCFGSVVSWFIVWMRMTMVTELNDVGKVTEVETCNQGNRPVMSDTLNHWCRVQWRKVFTLTSLIPQEEPSVPRVCVCVGPVYRSRRWMNNGSDVKSVRIWKDWCINFSWLRWDGSQCQICCYFDCGSFSDQKYNCRDLWGVIEHKPIVWRLFGVWHVHVWSASPARASLRKSKVEE